MSTYLVVKRMKEDRVYLPGEMLTDPPSAALLVERGFLTIVPDNFTPPPPAAPRSYGKARSVPSSTGELEGSSVEPSGTSGSDHDAGSTAEPPPPTLDELIKLNRADLNEMAAELGIEEPDELASKRIVAEAILAKAREDGDKKPRPAGSVGAAYEGDTRRNED